MSNHTTSNSSSLDQPTVIVVGSGIIATGLVNELVSAFPLVRSVADIAEASDVQQACDHDVVVILATHWDHSTESISELASVHPRLLAVLVEASPDLAIPLLRSGVAGCVLLAEGTTVIVDAIHATANGDAPLSPVVARWLLDAWNAEAPSHELTEREYEVLTLVTDGLANKQIARRLGISERTVKAHLTRVFQRIGASSRVEAALWLSRNRDQHSSGQPAGRHARPSAPITSSVNSAWRNDSMQRRRVGPKLPSGMPMSAAAAS